jgi:carbonic anhydrase/acetyltransferase-like protein (isoleucine patch superfamily)
MGRLVWTVTTLAVVEGLVCALSVIPVLLVWSGLVVLAGSNHITRLAIFSAAVMPSYLMFAVCLMIVSPLVIRLIGWRSPEDAEMRIAEMGWPLLRWIRYLATIHLVRVVAGTLFRGTPIWTAHLRLYGARVGRRVFVNSLYVSDYNLLHFGDDVVIGAAAHVAGHTVEHGIVKTAAVRLSRNVTIGLGSVIEIGVDVGPDCEIGALSFVPKRTKLEGGAVYAGIPVTRIG